MHRRRTSSWTAVLFLCLALLPVALEAQPQSGRREFTFRGTVDNVDVAGAALRVNHEAIEGWMPMGMIMTFNVQPADVLKQLKVGDRIIATVYEGNQTTLYNVRVDTSAPAAAASELPPVSYVCPSPGEEAVIEDKPGTCPKSGAPLIPIRIVTAYSCLRTTVVIREAPGVCPIDRSPLVPITAGMHFTCENDPTVYEMDPGLCSDGKPRVKRFERRAHGDHNPRHGGPYVAMSADQNNHLEGTLTPPGLFRLYFYDNMTLPKRVTGMSGYVMLTDANAQTVGSKIPLVAAGSADGSTLQAAVGNATLPFRVRAFIQFAPGSPEQIFDYTFAEFSKDPQVP